jgi:digeranylgeranylglycerophospholipid reductase
MRMLEINSPKTRILLEGDVGFFCEIGGENGIEVKARKSIEKFLPVHYSTKVESRKELQENFDAVIAADGYRSMLAREAGLRSKTPKRVGVAIGFTVKGDFDPESMVIWFGNRFSFHGYAYAIPFSKYEASLVSTSIGKTVDSETYRGRLREIATSRKWQIQDEWIDFESWYDFSSYCRDNIYVIGNAGSFTEPAYGFGLKWAIESAKLCARAIHKKIDFTIWLKRTLFRSWVLGM